MEAGLFVTSGTMGNLGSLLAHCQRGQDVILGDQSHIYHYENGSASAIGGMVLHPVPDERGRHASARRARGGHPPAVAQLPLLPLGAARRDLPREHAQPLRRGDSLAGRTSRRWPPSRAKHALPVHLDGARLFNAAVAAGRPVTDWTRHVSSVQLCLSKGLAAPVGSMICGTAAFVDRARRMRKILGGGMRQAGVIAAPGIVALTEMVDRLAEDHANARILAEGVAAAARRRRSTSRRCRPTSWSSRCRASAEAETLAGRGGGRGRAAVGLRRRPPADGDALRHHGGRLRQGSWRSSEVPAHSKQACLRRRVRSVSEDRPNHANQDTQCSHDCSWPSRWPLGVGARRRAQAHGRRGAAGQGQGDPREGDHDRHARRHRRRGLRDARSSIPAGRPTGSATCRR